MITRSPKDNLPKFKLDYLSGSEIMCSDIEAAHIHDGAEFVRCALNAAENVNLITRQTIQSDIANVLSCKREDLSFLWELTLQGAEHLDCAIPDSRWDNATVLNAASAAE